MPQPNQAHDAHASGHDIATSFEQGAQSKNLSQFVQKLREEQTVDKSKPNDWQTAITQLNDDLHHSSNPRIQAIMSNFDVIGYDSEHNGAVIKNLSTGREQVLMADGRVLDKQTGAVADQNARGKNGEYIKHGTDGKGNELTVTKSQDGKTEVDKYKDKDGKTWEIQKEMQADGAMHPTKVTMPDGSKLEYQWNKVGSTMMPTHFKETSSKGEVEQDYEMNVKTLSDKSTMYDTIHWNKKGGKGPDQLTGNIRVFPDGTFREDIRQPYMSLTLNPDGNYTKYSFNGTKLNTDKGRRGS